MNGKIQGNLQGDTAPLLNQGISLHNSGKLDEAEKIYRSILIELPQNADVHNLLGLIAYQKGRSEIALKYFNTAINLNPTVPEYYNNCGLANRALKKHELAISCYKKALNLNPEYPEANNNLGVAFVSIGHVSEGIKCYEKAIKYKPQYYDAYRNMGNALLKNDCIDEAINHFNKAININTNATDILIFLENYYQEKGMLEDAKSCLEKLVKVDIKNFSAWYKLAGICIKLNLMDEAISSLKKVIEQKPDFAEAHNNLGVALKKSSKIQEALLHLEKAIEINPEYQEALHNLGMVLQMQGKFQEALLKYRQVLSLNPDFVEAQNNLGMVLNDLGHRVEAVSAFEKAISLNPDFLDAYNNLGTAFSEIGLYLKAIACYKKVLSLDPENYHAYNNLGRLYSASGKLEEAVEYFEKSLSLNTSYFEAHNNLLMTLSYIPSTTNKILADKIKSLSKPLNIHQVKHSFNNLKNKDKKLKVGYVSGDFSHHPVSFFLLRVFSSHDKSNFEISCYANSSKTDEITDEIKKCSDHWNNITGLSDKEVFEQILKDEIDILVDLSGHTAKNRLNLFSLKPAPVQISWLGYFATTGLDVMDYIIADNYVLPENEEGYYVEKVKRLPDSYLCFDFPTLDLDVEILPAKVSKKITFGCFNNYTKINSLTISVWSEIMKSVPESNLLLKFYQYGSPEIQCEVYEKFEMHNIKKDRILMEGATPRPESLARYHAVDIALDPIPFGGGTTTAESLWMGVPVVTMTGETWVGRVSESILKTVGYPELVAYDYEQYKKIAITLCNDIAKLESIRASLRNKMAISPFCNGKKFAKNLEKIFRETWEDWCVKN